MARKALRYEPEEWAEHVQSGDVRAAARLMRLLDDHDPLAFEVMKFVYRATGRARVLGVTGNPGAGKSTLVNRLIGYFRRQGLSVGVVAVDPSSPFTGGAILGDRIRMQQFATDPGVFIRSQATRGKLGGLAGSTNDIVNVLDAMGYEIVMVETVGVGQDEIDIMKLADSVAVIMIPGLGDDIQAIKAGIMEIADVFVLNKADRDGADRTHRDLAMVLSLSDHDATSWLPPIVKTVAARGEGIDDLVGAIARHRDWMAEGDRLATRRRQQLRLRVETVLKERILAAARSEAGLEEQVAAGFAAHIDPYRLADELFRGVVRAESARVAADAEEDDG